MSNTQRDLSLTVDNQDSIFVKDQLSPINQTKQSTYSYKPITVIKKRGLKADQSNGFRKDSIDDTIDTFLKTHSGFSSKFNFLIK